MNRLTPTTTLASGIALGLLLSAGCKEKNEHKSEQKPSTDNAEKPAADQRTPLSAGTVAPDFTAEAHDGTTVKLSELAGQPVILYFYPKDETPG